LNTSILETVQLQGRAFVSSTVMNDVFWLRACVLNPRTTLDDIEQLIAAVNDVARSSMTELAE
jgi:hypothetical protein